MPGKDAADLERIAGGLGMKPRKGQEDGPTKKACES
jgi:hypothetical protein